MFCVTLFKPAGTKTLSFSCCKCHALDRDNFNNRRTKRKERRANVFTEIVIHLVGSKLPQIMTNCSFIQIVYQCFADLASSVGRLSG